MTLHRVLVVSITKFHFTSMRWLGFYSKLSSKREHGEAREIRDARTKAINDQWHAIRIKIMLQLPFGADSVIFHPSDDIHADISQLMEISLFNDETYNEILIRNVPPIYKNLDSHDYDIDFFNGDASTAGDHGGTPFNRISDMDIAQLAKCCKSKYPTFDKIDDKSELAPYLYRIHKYMIWIDKIRCGLSLYLLNDVNAIVIDYL